MPLPEGGKIPWPPKECEPVYRQYAIWGAWWSADIDRLAAIYSGDTTRDTTGFFASETGGFKATARRVVDSIKRWFWGSTATSRQPRQRVHVPLAEDIAQASAALLFSEPPTIVAAEPAPTTDDSGDTAEPAEDALATTQARLDLYREDSRQTLLEAANTCAGLGGVFLRVNWNTDLRDRPWMDAIHPDAAVPEWAYGRILVAVTFWRCIHKTALGQVVRHLERHSRGLIENAVYVGSDEKLGAQAPLDTYDATTGLVPSYATEFDGLTAAYVPNVRPAKCWRGNPNASALGAADIAGCESLLDGLDLAESSWMRDVDLGKARLIVPQQMLMSHGPGQGASIDLDREVYEGVNTMDADRSDIKEVQFAIRWQEHKETTSALKQDIVHLAGYSPQTFGLAGEVAVTATEVAAKERRSLTTRDVKIGYWTPELVAIYHAMLHIDATVFGADVIVAAPTLEWPDAVSIDPEAQARTLRELEAAAAMSTVTKVRLLHPDWDGDQVDDEVERIHEERNIAQPVEAPDMLAGFGGQQPPPPDPDAEDGDDPAVVEREPAAAKA